MSIALGEKDKVVCAKKNESLENTKAPLKMYILPLSEWKKRQKLVRWILEFFSFIFDLEFLIFGFSNCTFKLEFELIFCPNHFTAGGWLCYSNVVSTKIYCT